MLSYTLNNPEHQETAIDLTRTRHAHLSHSNVSQLTKYFQGSIGIACERPEGYSVFLTGQGLRTAVTRESLPDTTRSWMGFVKLGKYGQPIIEYKAKKILNGCFSPVRCGHRWGLVRSRP